MISLCMICGNEEGIITKCLQSAKGAFDELCLVVAVGDQITDKTKYTAEKWCAENRKGFACKTYTNSTPFPHIDDFAAARNMSFELAAYDWILWLDCDDYLDPINVKRVREAVKTVPDDVNAIFAAYLFAKQNSEILRERLIRKGKGRWKNPVHEVCAIEGKFVNCPQLKIFHSDHSKKNTSSAKRNAAIIGKHLEDSSRHHFYLHTENKMLGNHAVALAAGKIALAMLGADKPEERYVVLLNMAELEPEQREAHLLCAVRIQPHRREAFAYLCQAALKDGRISDAISYFRLMDSLPVPSPVPWTHDGIWYGWARHFLRARVLDASGHKDQAEMEHKKHMKEPEYAEAIANMGKESPHLLSYEHPGRN